MQSKECHMPTVEEVRTVTADGRLVVPWVIQRALGLEHGGPVRFRVENGVVTLVAVEARRGRVDQDAAPRPGDIRAALAEELRTLLNVAERDGRVEPSQASEMAGE
jgi:bifunctional DNA-binding transcriptional regulator/antitoxin component of YhaV-PrlF toxin-antitoxin module